MHSTTEASTICFRLAKMLDSVGYFCRIRMGNMNFACIIRFDELSTLRGIVYSPANIDVCENRSD